MRILIIEDEEKLAKNIKLGLEKFGFSADYVLDGESGEQRARLYRNDYDLIILDLILPKRDGLSVCKAVRAEGITVPVLVLTAKESPENKVMLLEAGADDYMVKPFSFEELVARIKALLRRPKAQLPSQIRAGDITVDQNSRKIYYHSKEIPVTLKEYAILEYFARSPGKAVSREELFSHVWDFASNAMSNTIDVHINSLRKKFNSIFRARHNGINHENIFETIKGVGYRIKV